jgi:hypothetical protein
MTISPQDLAEKFVKARGNISTVNKVLNSV